MSKPYLSYSSLGNNLYSVNLMLMRDCSAVNPTNTEYVSVSSLSLNNTFGVIINLDSSFSYSGSFCISPNILCYTANIGLPGFQNLLYTGTVSLPSTATDWIFSYNSCCRNYALVNINNNSFSTFAKLNNSLGQNNGILFNQPSLICIAGINNYTNLGVYNNDGDSLVYSLVTPIDNTDTTGAITNSTYKNGYSLAQPLGANGSISIDSTTGLLSYYCSNIGWYAIDIKIDEYRNGVLIGTYLKDITLTFVSSSNTIPLNTSPILSGINGGASFDTIVYICGTGSTNLNFVINSSDSNLTDSSRIEFINNGIPATFTKINSKNQFGFLNWNISLSDVRSEPYSLNFKVLDNVCPMNGERILTYRVFVNMCNTDSVWAGDANDDLIVNNNDFFDFRHS
jgi:hypothetical protein